MRVETLSDHPGDLLAAAERERRREIAAQDARLVRARRDRDRARSDGRWLAWLRLVFTVRREKRAAARQPLATRVPTAQEERARAGHDAEQRVEADLGRALGSDWTLFRGYRNRRGEIDGLLLGPTGLFAIEVKYHNATVYIHGDHWSSEKYDNYGNLVRARAPMHDQGDNRRSPSQQLTQPAAELAQWLGKHGLAVTPACVVLLTHPSARIGAMRSPTVRVVTSAADLLGVVRKSSPRLDARQRAQVADLIRRDHRFHQKRRPSR